MIDLNNPESLELLSRVNGICFTGDELSETSDLNSENEDEL